MFPVLGCEEEDPAKEIDECIEQSIAQGKKANWTQGVWKLSGSGERSNCSDESLDTDSLDLSSKGVRVHQQGHFLFLENPSQYPGFSLSGMVGDRCIHVKTTEQTSYGIVSYDFPARFMTSAYFHGPFRSSGPKDCEGKGTFSVAAKLDPVPASASNNPAPSDAGTSQQQLCDNCLESCDRVDQSYFAECLSGCQFYVCKTSPVLDAGDAKANDVDAQQDSPQEASEDAETGGDVQEEPLGDAPEEVELQDAGEGGLEDSGDADAGDATQEGDSAEQDATEEGSDAAEEASDASEEEDAEASTQEAGDAPSTEAGDALSDKPVDGLADGDLVYELWDGSATDDESDTEDKNKVCSVSTPGGRADRTIVLLLLGVLGGLGLRRRRPKGARR